jgi:gluconokinase
MRKGVKIGTGLPRRRIPGYCLPRKPEVGIMTATTMPPVVLMGVSGSGKTTVGQALAQRLEMPFIEADDLHPKSNRDKMAAGIPLTDDDRWPWLDAMGTRMEEIRREGHGVIATCSALKRSYRDRLRAKVNGPLLFVLLDSPKPVLATRMAARKGHFMPPALLDSQLATLEKPSPGEPETLILDGTRPVAELVAAIAGAVGAGADLRN